LKRFKEVGYERVLDYFLTILHKGRDFSLGNISFGETKYLSNVNIGEVLDLCFGRWNACHDGGGGG